MTTYYTTEVIITKGVANIGVTAYIVCMYRIERKNNARAVNLQG